MSSATSEPLLQNDGSAGCANASAKIAAQSEAKRRLQTKMQKLKIGRQGRAAESEREKLAERKMTDSEMHHVQQYRKSMSVRSKAERKQADQIDALVAKNARPAQSASAGPLGNADDGGVFVQDVVSGEMRRRVQFTSRKK